MEKENKEQKVKDKVNKNEEKLKNELDKVMNLLEEEKNKSMRISAEMINFKKRKDEEISYMLKYASEDLIIKLLGVVDNFERAIKMDSEDLTDELSRFLSGFKMIYSNLVGILNDAGIKEIEASGVEFDPNYHQAVLTEHDESKPAGIVLEVLQKGYLYKDKVIRPAMVKVNE